MTMVEQPESASGKPEPPLTIFESIARLFVASDPTVPSSIVEVGPRWDLDLNDRAGAVVLIWGAPPKRPGSVAATARWAMRREKVLHSARIARPPFRTATVHRLPPPRRATILRNAYRRHLLSGAAIDWAIEPGIPRAIDSVLEAAGAQPGVASPVRPSRDGSVLMGIDRGGEAAQLRMAAKGSSKIPANNADALVTLARRGLPYVPRLIDRGEAARVDWTLEVSMSGRIPAHLTDRLLAQVLNFCAQLANAREGGRVRSIVDRVEHLVGLLPGEATRLREVANDVIRVAMQPVIQHGDLWLGNLLVRGSDLIGVIDWDTWHPSGVPGSDLIHLLAMHRRARTGEDIGDLFQAHPWHAPIFTELTRAYWRSVQIEPTASLLDAAAADWWAGQVLKRKRKLSDAAWVDRNVLAVLEDMRNR